MNRRITLLCLSLLFVPLAGAEELWPAASSCAAFRWNVASELAVMQLPAIAIAARADAGNPATVVVGKHYVVTLAAQSGVKFAVPPAHATKGAAPRGGTLRLVVEVAGRYRVSLTSRHWIDVVDGDKVIESLDHEGHADCALLHKIVEYQLPAHRPLDLQISGADEDAIGLAITPSPGG